jgi:hypothetical protein
MKVFRSRLSVVSWLALMLASTPSSACSPASEQPFNVEEWSHINSPEPTQEPAVRSVVHRGRPARRNESTCVEIAVAVLYVRDDSPGLPYVYSFEQVSGDPPEPIFPKGLYRGTRNASGELEFRFYWFDLSKSPKPFSVGVRVTPHSRAGVPGPSTVVIVESET